jgi:hypothetical protein
MERLAAQIPKPRINLVLYAGVLAPNAKLRPDFSGGFNLIQSRRPARSRSVPAEESRFHAAFTPRGAIILFQQPHAEAMRENLRR